MAFPLGYKHMCHFWSMDFMDYLSEYKYIIRIDEDCFITKFNEIILEKMRDEEIYFSSPMFQEQDKPYVIVGLEKITKPNMKVLVISDSKYVVDAVEKKWVFGWEKKSFKDKKNPDLWMRFLKIYRQHQVDFKWIKGHNNHPQNERCDELAVMASGLPNLSVDAFYEKENNDLFKYNP